MSEIYFSPIVWKENEPPALDAVNMNRIENCLEELVAKANNDGIHVLAEDLVLWMGATQEVELSETVSSQKNGIVLRFSTYDQNTSTPWNNGELHYEFIPKTTTFGQGVMFSWFINGHLTTKYIYVHDDKLTGYSGNEAPDDTYAGITRKNKNIILRAVYGV